MIPESYLINDFPYYCGVSTCKKPFSDYFALYQHASQHSQPMISSFPPFVFPLVIAMNNQLFFPPTFYHCPVPSCEVAEPRWFRF